MAATHGAGPFFWSLVNLDNSSPRYHVADTYETSFPYRLSHSKVFRLGGRGLVIGWWKLNPDIEKHSDDFSDEFQDAIIAHLYKAINSTKGTGSFLEEALAHKDNYGSLGDYAASAD